MSKPKKKPFVLITVRGGVATVWDNPDIDYEIVDWDNWDCEVATLGDIEMLKEIAERLSPADRKTFIKQVDELEVEGEGERAYA